MIGRFFRDNPDFYAAELKNVKTAESARDSYGDDAIGYVQLHRESGVCTLKCKICPEHKIRKKSYNVTMVVNENEGDVVSCQCHDCAASAGGCKHAVAVLMWVHRRSEEPASTSMECYWKKPTLSRVGTNIKSITVQEICKKKVPQLPSSSALLTEFILEAMKRKIDNCELLKYQTDFHHVGVLQYSMHHFMIGQSTERKNDVDKLVEAMREKFDKNVINMIEKATRNQSKSSLWYELRYGRVTASKAHEVSVCHTTDGSLVAAIMGAKIPDTAAMKRGRDLELSVRATVANKLGNKFTSCGLFISQEYPMIAASPDGVSKDAIIEIKCPTSDKAKNNYIKNGTITEKYTAQVQIQMYTSGKKKCYFSVADADFENSKNVDIIKVSYDELYVTNLINKITAFWSANIYPILNRNTNIDS